MNADSIVYYKEGMLVLDTGMSESTFSKSRLVERITEKGILAKKEDNDWTLSFWSFDNTLTDELNHDVLWTAPGFEGNTLKAYLEGDDKALKVKASATVVAVLEKILQSDFAFTSVGSGGIFISSDFNSVLFLPSVLFSSSVSCRSENINATYNELYLHENLTGKAAIRFTQAVISYRALTDKMPYNKINTVERHEDYLDHNYIPLKACIYGMDKELSGFIDSYLSIKMPKVQNKGAASKYVNIEIDDIYPLVCLYKELGLEENGDIPLTGILNKPQRNSDENQKVFEERCKKELNLFAKRLNRKRWFRHNKTMIGIASGVAVILAFFIVTYNAGASAKPTTKSLNSVQTVSMFYSAINRLDVDGVSLAGKGKRVKQISDTVSNFYVTGKAISMYDGSKSTVTPATWLNWNYDGGYRIFGITQFKVDNNEQSIFFTGPAKNTKGLQPLTEENGKTLAEGDTVVHNVSFYLLYTDDGETLHVLTRNDTVTLTYTGKKWLVTGCEVEEEDSISSCSELYADYVAAVNEADKDIKKICDILRVKYYWLSTDKEVQEAYKDLQENMPT